MAGNEEGIWRLVFVLFFPGCADIYKMNWTKIILKRLEEIVILMVNEITECEWTVRFDWFWINSTEMTEANSISKHHDWMASVKELLIKTDVNILSNQYRHDRVKVLELTSVMKKLLFLFIRTVLITTFCVNFNIISLFTISYIRIYQAVWCKINSNGIEISMPLIQPQLDMARWIKLIQLLNRVLIYALYNLNRHFLTHINTWYRSHSLSLPTLLIPVICFIYSHKYISGKQNFPHLAARKEKLSLTHCVFVSLSLLYAMNKNHDKHPINASSLFTSYAYYSYSKYKKKEEE